MSPVIFNMIIDRLLKTFSEKISARVDGVSVNAAAFEGDILLFASTPVNLQKLIYLPIS